MFDADELPKNKNDFYPREIVIPIIVKGKVIAVLDIDSPVKARFDQQDQSGLEQLINTLADRLDFSFLS